MKNSKKKTLKVRLTVFWADDSYDSSIVITKKLWETIQQGKSYKKNGPGYSGESSDGYCKWQDVWIFENKKLIVRSYMKKDRGEFMDVYSGSITGLYVDENLA